MTREAKGWHRRVGQFNALKPGDRIRQMTGSTSSSLAHVMCVDIERGIGAAREWSPYKRRWRVIEITRTAFGVGLFWVDGDSHPEEENRP